ncbi:MAG: glycosyltransferase family 39 protein [Chloroflexota bacterium]|nr:glycosyltransferase family 39 protein [Chloroflexota bacterium]
MTTLTRPGIGLELPDQSRRGLLTWIVRGRVEDAAWVQPAFWGVTVLAAVLYVVNLTVSGFANTYYSAAALAASQSWSAWFFGSIDAANFITVDKPPLSTMLMGLSVRVFGLSSWSVLLPQALAGVATVALLFAVVRRSFGPAAAIIAALVAALTPAAVLIFRYNNPDALLTLLLVASAWAFVRAIEDDRMRWVLLSALFVGLAFNTKYLQAYLVLPAFAVTYAIAAPGHVWRRLGGLAVALVTVVVASGWWVLAVEFIPATARPFIGGSTNNSALDLLFGYDGLARIFGSGGGGGGGGFSGGPGGPGGGFSGASGLLRLFNAELGGQISWLVGFALLGLASGLWLRRHAPRTDRARAGYLMWGLWLLVHVAVFSFMTGIIHSYYAVAMAPAVGALVGAGVVELWSARSRTWWAGPVLGAAILGSGIWAWQLLDRTPTFAPGLGLVIVVVSAVAAVIVSLPPSLEQVQTQLLAVGLGVAMLLAGPATYAIETMQTAYSGGDPSAGPTVSGGFGGGVAGGADGGGITADSTLVQYLLANRGSTTWIVATTSAQEAGSIELATGAPVMAMGGFMGSDPAPTLDQFKALVAAGKVRYVLISGAGGFGPRGQGSGSTVSEVNAWAASAGTQVTSVGRGTLYDLSALATTAS